MGVVHVHKHKQTYIASINEGSTYFKNLSNSNLTTLSMTR